MATEETRLKGLLGGQAASKLAKHRDIETGAREHDRGGEPGESRADDDHVVPCRRLQDRYRAATFRLVVADAGGDAAAALRRAEEAGHGEHQEEAAQAELVANTNSTVT